MDTALLRFARARVHDADGVCQVMNSLMAELGPCSGVDALVTTDGVAAWLRRLAGDDRGVIFIARAGEHTVGCCALEPVDDSDDPAVARLRTWVLPEQRGHGLGHRLAELAIAEAQALGYERIAVRLPANASADAFLSSLVASLPAGSPHLEVQQ